MALSVSTAFKKVWARAAGKDLWTRVSYQRRYYSNVSPAGFLYETTWTDLGPGDYVAVGRIPWLLDTPNLNEFKTTEVTISLNNKDHRWIPAKSAPSVFAADGGAPDGYTAILTRFRLQCGYKLPDESIEYVSMFTGVMTGLRFSSDRASVDVVVSSNARLLQAGDATQVSDELLDEALVKVDNDGKVWETSSTGVYQMPQVRNGAGTALTQGVDYTVSELNQAGPARVTFTSAQVGSPGPHADLILWKLNKRIEELVELLCGQAGIQSGSRTINPVVFPGGVSGSKTYDTQARWAAGSKVNTTATKIDGSVVLDWACLDDFEDGDLSGWTKVTNYGTIKVSGGKLNMDNSEELYHPATQAYGTWEFKVKASGTNPFGVLFIKTSTSSYALFFTNGKLALLKDENFNSPLASTNHVYSTEKTYRITRSASGEFKVYVNGSGSATLTATDNDYGDCEQFYLKAYGISSQKITVDDIRYKDSVDSTGSFATTGTWISDENDLLQAPDVWGAMQHNEVLNGGTILIETAVASLSGGPYDAWTELGAGGQILSAKKRYLKIRLTITSNDGAISSPEMQKLVANFSISSVFVSVANFSGKTCFSAIQRLAQLADYEWGFNGNGNFFFRSKAVSGDALLSISYVDVISRISDYTLGWDDVRTRGRVRYNDYVAEYSCDDGLSVSPALETSPTPMDIYGDLVEDEDQSDILLANDSNLAAARARLIHDNRHLPKETFRIEGKLIPWLELSDIIKVTAADDPFLLENFAGDPLQGPPRPMPAGPAANLLANGMPVKIIGFTPNLDEHWGEYIVQRVLS